MMNRIINTYTNGNKGPLLIVLAAMHGNEIAGVKAVKQVFERINDEPIKNPNFCFYGKMIGVVGNVKAYEKGVRFINKDINRQLIEDNVKRIRQSSDEVLDSEDKEIKALLNLIDAEVESYKPEKLCILDLHTTSAEGGIFTIPSKDAESVQIALDIHAPVVQGMLDGMQGTTLHYFKTANMTVDTTAITFEAGQHYNEKSVKNAVSAVINCLRAIGCVEHKNIEEKHNNWLYEMSKELPVKTRLIHRQAVSADEEFVMKPGFKNFQKVEKNTLLATNKYGEIRNDEEARILMPLYQPQGEDGFFLIKDVLD